MRFYIVVLSYNYSHSGVLGVDAIVSTSLRRSPPNGNITSVGWQVTLCDPIWHVSSRSGVATLRTAMHLLLTYLLRSPTADVISVLGSMLVILLLWIATLADSPVR